MIYKSGCPKCNSNVSQDVFKCPICGAILWKNISFLLICNLFFVAIVVAALVKLLGRQAQEARRADEGGTRKVRATQEASAGMLALRDCGSVYTNTLNMVFVPVPGTSVLFCKWETRVKDFEEFVTLTRHDATSNAMRLGASGWAPGGTWRTPGFTQGPMEPVCGVSWDDAQAFCKWLTEKERINKRIPVDRRYRLPTKREWKKAAIPGGAVSDSAGQDMSTAVPYLWGSGWPPPKGCGNFAGTEIANANWCSSQTVIDGYSDGYPRTAPVGSFSANAHGLFDLEGNVSEWCENPDDDADDDGKRWLLLGGSWFSSDSESLQVSSSRHAGRGECWTHYGFRCVLTSCSP